MNKISKYKIKKKNQLLKALKAKQIVIKIMRIKLIQIQIEHDIFNF
jgi:hypothetical protein